MLKGFVSPILLGGFAGLIISIMYLKNKNHFSSSTSLNNHQIKELENIKKALRISEERFRVAFQTSPDSMNITRLEDGLYVEVNESFTAITGYPREEAIGKTAFELNIWEDHKDRDHYVAEIKKNGYVKNLKVKFRVKDGSIKYGLISSKIIKLGNVPHILSATKDISDLIQVEKKLQESKELFYNAFNNAPIGMTILNKDHKFSKVNQKFCDILGYTQEELLNKTMEDITYPEDIDISSRSLDTLYQDKKSQTFNIKKRYLHANGDIIWGNLNVSLITDQQGKPLYTIGQLEDITEKKKAEEALKESAEHYRLLFEAANDAIFLMDGERFVDCNAKTLSIFGCTREQIINQPPYLFSPKFQPDGRASKGKALEKINGALGGNPQFFEWRHCQYDKTEFDAEVSLNKLTLSGKPYLLAIVRDVTERKKAEKALRASEEKFRTMVENSNDMIWMMNTEGKFIYVNKRAEKVTGYKISEVLGKEIDDFVPTGDIAQLKKVLQESLKGDSQHFQANIIHKNGSLLTVSINKAPIYKDGKIVGAVSFARDITEELQLKKELTKAEKLESIGVLAGGIAHDFNNFLTGILGSLSLAKMGLNSDSETFEYLDEAEKATVRARDLTQQLLTFSKGGEPIKKTTLITNLIEDTVSFVLRGSNVKPEFFFDKNLDQVEIDAGQISQVIHNLILNAKQAMPGGGTINIRVQNKEFKEETNLPLEKGKYVKIIITDEGTGIPEKILPKVFDPYFTTKQSGSGLGLASCYSIIKKHNGYIAVTSKLGEGTTFKIYLPASKNKIKIKKEDILENLSGTGCILIMDDEEIIRHLSGKILTKFGYTVDYAKEGSEAIQLYKQALGNNRPYDAVILDMTVPGGIGGLETLEHLRRLDSNVRAIVCSGYSNDPVMADYRKYGFCGVLPKPFRPKELGYIIKQVLQDNVVPVNS